MLSGFRPSSFTFLLPDRKHDSALWETILNHTLLFPAWSSTREGEAANRSKWEHVARFSFFFFYVHLVGPARCDWEAIFQTITEWMSGRARAQQRAALLPALMVKMNFSRNFMEALIQRSQGRKQFGAAAKRCQQRSLVGGERAEGQREDGAALGVSVINSTCCLSRFSSSLLLPNRQKPVFTKR